MANALEIARCDVRKHAEVIVTIIVDGTVKHIAPPSAKTIVVLNVKETVGINAEEIVLLHVIIHAYLDVAIQQINRQLTQQVEY